MVYSVQKMLLVSAFVMTTTALTGAFSGVSYAAEGFYLEIGKQGTADYANVQWKDLSGKYKKTLGELTFYPKSVTNQNGETVHVIQAGVVADKHKAQKICGQLFAKNIPCFVIEGIEDRPPAMSQNISKVSGGVIAVDSSLPWISDAPKVLGQISAPSATPVISAPPAPKEPQITKKVEGKVDVAQAIPVPLSDKVSGEEVMLLPPEQIVKNPLQPSLQPSSQPIIITKDLPQTEPAMNKYEHSDAYEERRQILRQPSSSKGIVEGNLPVITHEDAEKQYWAQVVIADSKNEAKQRLEEIKSANSDILNGLSSTITTSPVRHAKYNARLGSLDSEQAATDLCNKLQQRGIDCLVITTK